jgi:G3E family GTPase
MTDPGGEAGAGELLGAWEALLRTIGGPRARARADTSGDRIPVTLLAGFLGAGKTTLLTRVIAEAAGQRILAIVNDIGSVNVDAETIRRQNARTLELTNGCSCCVLGSDLLDMLSAVGDSVDAPDHIVLEASGLADPMGIAQTIVAAHGVTLDGVVTLVDAATLEEHWHDPAVSGLFRRQIESAHLLVLTKASDTEDLAIRERLGERAPGRPVLLANRNEASAAVITGVAMRGARPEPGSARHELGAFRAETVIFPDAVRADGLEQVLARAPSSLFRIKGQLTEERIGREIEVQGVGQRWQIRPTKSPRGRGSSGQLVVIGRNRDEHFEAFVDELRSLARERERLT